MSSCWFSLGLWLCYLQAHKGFGPPCAWPNQCLWAAKPPKWGSFTSEHKTSNWLVGLPFNCELKQQNWNISENTVYTAMSYFRFGKRSVFDVSRLVQAPRMFSCFRLLKFHRWFWVQKGYLKHPDLAKRKMFPKPLVRTTLLFDPWP